MAPKAQPRPVTLRLSVRQHPHQTIFSLHHAALYRLRDACTTAVSLIPGYHVRSVLRSVWHLWTIDCPRRDAARSPLLREPISPTVCLVGSSSRSLQTLAISRNMPCRSRSVRNDIYFIHHFRGFRTDGKRFRGQVISRLRLDEFAGFVDSGSEVPCF